MSLDTVVGVLIGSGISIVVTYLNHRWSEKREKQKIEMERENEAISQIFSPLVFILDKARNLFARIAALNDTLKKIPKVEEQQKIVSALIYLTVKKATLYPQALEDLLLHKSGLIEPSQFYFDLGLLQSYLSTIVDFVQLAYQSEKDLHKLRQYFATLAPLVIQLDKAISQMRKYAMARTARFPKYEYKQFFTEEKHSELEGYLNKAHQTLTSENIPEWSSILGTLLEDKGEREEKEKEG